MTAPATALVWPVDALQAGLQPLLPGVQVRVEPSVDSSNTQLLQRLQRQPSPPQLLVAETQRDGRGRNGRRWHSAAGASLTFSLGLSLAPADWSGLSLVVGQTLADAIEPFDAERRPRLLLKWPNDLWLADSPGACGPWRKLGGILIETVAAAASRVCVVGVGLNVRPQPGLPGLDSGFASVDELDPTLDAPTLLGRVAPPLVRALLRFERDGFAPFASAFARRDLLRGLAVHAGQAASAQGAIDGVADGVDERGALRVLQAGGTALVGSGEVSVRPLSAPSAGER